MKIFKTPSNAVQRRRTPRQTPSYAVVRRQTLATAPAVNDGAGCGYQKILSIKFSKFYKNIDSGLERFSPFTISLIENLPRLKNFSMTSITRTEHLLGFQHITDKVPLRNHFLET